MLKRLTVQREMIPTEYSEWVQRPYTVTVWSHDGICETVTHVHSPNGYASGFLRCCIGGDEVDLDTFDAALVPLGLTRADIRRAIESPPTPDAVDPHADSTGKPGTRA